MVGQQDFIHRGQRADEGLPFFFPGLFRKGARCGCKSPRRHLIDSLHAGLKPFHSIGASSPTGPQMCAAGRSMRANRPIRAVDWYPHPPRFSRLNVSHSGPNVMFCCMGPHMARGRWGVCRQALSIWLQALSWHWIRGMLGQTAMSQPMSALMPPIGLLWAHVL